MAIHPAVFRALSTFYRILDARTAQLEEAHPEVLCPPTCSQCCLGSIFFVTALDFAYVCRYATANLDEATRGSIITQAEAQVAECGAELARELDGSDTRIEAPSGLTCPLLEHGRCRVYPARPTPCRLFGRTRYQSGKLNICDIIFNRLPEGGNGNADPGHPPAIRFPIVEDMSRSLAAMLRRELGPEGIGEAERLLHVSTLPIFIATTRFEELRVYDVTPEA